MSLLRWRGSRQCTEQRAADSVGSPTSSWLQLPGSGTAEALQVNARRHPLSSGAAFLRGDESPRVHTWREATTAFHSCVGRPPHNCLQSWLSSLAGKVCLSLECQGREPGLHGGHAPCTLPASLPASGCAGRRGSCEARETEARETRFPGSVLGRPREPREPRQGGQEIASLGEICPQQVLC